MSSGDNRQRVTIPRTRRTQPLGIVAFVGEQALQCGVHRQQQRHHLLALVTVSYGIVNRKRMLVAIAQRMYGTAFAIVTDVNPLASPSRVKNSRLPHPCSNRSCHQIREHQHPARDMLPCAILFLALEPAMAAGTLRPLRTLGQIAPATSSGQYIENTVENLVERFRWHAFPALLRLRRKQLFEHPPAPRHSLLRIVQPLPLHPK